MLALPLTDTLLGLEPHLHHLEASGWRVRAVATPSRRGPIVLLDSPPHVLRIQGRAIREVRLQLGGKLFGLVDTGHSTATVGAVPVYMSRTVPMQAHWVVPADPSGRLEDFEARLSTRRGGFLWLGEIESAAWQGGALAAVLNEDPESSLAGARFLRRGERLFVTPDPEQRCVRLVHQTRVIARLSLLSSEILTAEWHLPERPMLEGFERVGKAILALGKPVRRRSAAKRRTAR